MPSALSYPGVYIEEISSGVRPIAGVATSITAFVGRALRGPTNEPIRIGSFGDFERLFGGIDYNCPMSYAVQHLFLNGGVDAIIVRVANVGDGGDAVKSNGEVNGLAIQAKGEGKWGDQIAIRIDHSTRDPERYPDEFNLTVLDKGSQSGESFRNISVKEDSPRYFVTVLEEESMLVEFPKGQDVPSDKPSAHSDLEDPLGSLFADANEGNTYSLLAEGDDGSDIDDGDVTGKESEKTGMYALEKADLFNILCIPPLTRKRDVSPDTYAKAAKYCIDRRAFLIVDAPQEVDSVEEGENQITKDGIFTAIGNSRKNAAMFIPRIKMPDPMKENRLQPFAPCGAVAGVMARTDVQRGVWKSPAGVEASLVGVTDLAFKMTDKENGRLNILGVNCIRNFPGVGNVVWGTRTLDGSDRLASEWKYLAVRRFTLFLEESLYRGTQWVVFEPNDEPLWAQIRLNVGAFMQNLFRQGAFQGRSPREAYFVRCGADTTNQNDINRGIVNIEVGFAPLKPAEFVILKFQQMTGKIDT